MQFTGRYNGQVFHLILKPPLCRQGRWEVGAEGGSGEGKQWVRGGDVWMQAMNQQTRYKLRGTCNTPHAVVEGESGTGRIL